MATYEMTDQWLDLSPGVRFRRVGGDASMGVYLVRMEPGAVVARDSHPERETSLVLEGAVIVDTWPASDPEGRRCSDAFGSADHDSDPAARRVSGIDIYPGLSHSLRAHPERGALLLTVARPDWGTP